MLIGISEIIMSPIIGKLSDIIGRAPTLLIGTLFYSLGLLFTGFIKSNFFFTPTLFGESWTIYGASVCFGFSDAIYNVLIVAVLGDFYPDNILMAFTIAQVFENLGSAVGYYYAIAFPLHGFNGTFVQIWVQFVVLCISTITIYLACVKYAPKKNMLINTNDRSIFY